MMTLHQIAPDPTNGCPIINLHCDFVNEFHFVFCAYLSYTQTGEHLRRCSGIAIELSDVSHNRHVKKKIKIIFGQEIE